LERRARAAGIGPADVDRVRPEVDVERNRHLTCDTTDRVGAKSVGPDHAVKLDLSGLAGWDVVGGHDDGITRRNNRTRKMKRRRQQYNVATDAQQQHENRCRGGEGIVPFSRALPLSRRYLDASPRDDGMRDCRIRASQRSDGVLAGENCGPLNLGAGRAGSPLPRRYRRCDRDRLVHRGGRGESDGLFRG